MFGIDDAALGALMAGAGSMAGGVGGLFGRSGGGTDWNAMTAQMNFQREMAQNSISWRVQDAKNAGVSPLVALGAPTFSPSISIPSEPFGPDIGASLRSMGAGAADLVKGLTPVDKRALAMQQMAADQQLKSNDLDIQIKGAQLARLQKLNSQPTFPDVRPGAGGSGQVNDPVRGTYEAKPPEVLNTQPGTPTATAGPPSPGTNFEPTPTGLTPRPNQKSIQDTDIFNPEYLDWAMRNKVFPNAARAPSPEYMAKHFPGAIGAKWNQFEFEWQPVYPKGHYEKGRFVPAESAPYPTPAYDRRR